MRREGEGRKEENQCLLNGSPSPDPTPNAFRCPFFHRNLTTTEAAASSPWHQRGRRSGGSERLSHCLRVAWLDNSRAGAQARVCVTCQLVFPLPHTAFNL